MWKHDSASPTTARGRSSYREARLSLAPVSSAPPGSRPASASPTAPRESLKSPQPTPTAAGSGRRVTWPNGAANQRSPLRYSNRWRGRRLWEAMLPPASRGLSVALRRHAGHRALTDLRAQWAEWKIRVCLPGLIGPPGW